MGKYILNGRNPLEGKIPIYGAKNSAVAILPAVILSDEPCIIENVPQINDVYVILEMLKRMGASVEMMSEHKYRIDATKLSSYNAPKDLSRTMRASYYFLGALLGKYKTASISMPGGCDLGPRPIDQHLKAFEYLGAQWDSEHGSVIVKSNDRLKGDHVFFDTVSVGATINAIIAAVKADGTTVLENVAKEPHIVDVANFLNSMGADVRGAGTDVIKIRGVERLKGSEYSVVPDQIEAGTYLVAAAATGGDVVIENVIPKHLESIVAKLIKAGADIEEFDDYLRVKRYGDIYSTNIRTMPHPGFPTDMQPQFAALLALAKGTSIISEGIWDSRFRYADELRRMGARIQVDGKTAVIEGVEGFHGANVKAPDLRAGAALVIAGLVADGKTEIGDIYHVERGYENIVGKLKDVGANIELVEDEDVEKRA